MSYCRWSSDDYQCDVYVYQHFEGYYSLNVAGNRRTPSEPFPPHVSANDDFAGWWARHASVGRMIEETPSKPIGLEFDNETFEFDTPNDCADKLLELKAMGYNVPQYAIDDLREESES